MQQRAPIHFELIAVNLDQKQPGFPDHVLPAYLKELGVPHEKVNVNGGACALGHPIGASGARIMVTLIHALKARGLKKGLATLCIGGGEGTAVALELL